jgi:hypothetical protein
MSDTEISAILTRFPGPVTLGLEMVREEATGGWLVIIFFGTGEVVSAAVLLLRLNALTLDRSGFEMKSLFRPIRVAWQDAMDFAAIAIPPSGIKMVGFKAASLKDRAASKLVRAVSGVDGTLPDTYGFSADELASLMTQWRDRSTT